jgi:hypothetical protein
VDTGALLHNAQSKRYNKFMKTASNKNIKIALAVLTLFLTVGVSIGVVVLLNLNNKPGDQSDTELRTQLGCGRMTEDYRETDVLCGNLQLYRSLVSHGIVLNESNTSSTVKLALISAQGKVSAMSNAEVKIGIQQVSPCLVAPCPTSFHEIWSGYTDSFGIVQVPRSKITDMNTTTVVSGKQTGSIYGSSSRSAYIVSMNPQQ